MTMMVAPPGGGHAPVIKGPGPNPSGLASPQNKPPKVGAAPPKLPKSNIGGSSKAPTPKTGLGQVAASKAVGSFTPMTSISPASLSNLASKAAAKIYSPIMQNYNAQLAQANGLAQKRTADVTAFGQWYGQQQQALSQQETSRQQTLSNLLGQLGNAQATTPQNGIQSSIGTNMTNPTGGAVALDAAGNNAAQTGILSTDALNNSTNSALGQNELTALGGSAQQNMMSAISSDLTKTQTTIEDAASKAYNEEGSAASKLDTNFTSYLNDQNKNVIAQNKNIVQANYDQQQANSKSIQEIEAVAAATGKMTPAMAAQIARLSGGAAPAAGTTVAGTKNTIAAQKNAIEAQKNNLTAYENVTKRMAVAATNTKTKDSFVIDTIKNNISQAEAGAKVTVSNAEAKYYAARTGLSVSQAKAELIKAYAYAAHYGVTGNGSKAPAGVVPFTTDEANTNLAKIPEYGNSIDNLMKPITKSGVTTPAVAKNQAQVRAYLNNMGAKASPLLWAAFDMKFNDGHLTPNTYQHLLNVGFTPSQLANYKVRPLKVK